MISEFETWLFTFSQDLTTASSVTGASGEFATRGVSRELERLCRWWDDYYFWSYYIIIFIIIIIIIIFTTIITICYYCCYHDLPWFADYKGFRSTQMPKEGDPHSLLQMICNPCQPILLVDWPNQLTCVLLLIFVCVYLYLCCKKYQSEKIVRNIGGITHNTN